MSLAIAAAMVAASSCACNNCNSKSECESAATECCGNCDSEKCADCDKAADCDSTKCADCDSCSVKDCCKAE